MLFPVGDVRLTHVLGPAINACAAALNRHGFTLVADATSYANPAAAANAWLRLDPAAFIDLTMAGDDPALLRMVSAGIPRVTFDLDVPNEWAAIDVISIAARKLQFEHVAERGARRVIWAVPSEFLSGRLGSLLREHQELNAVAAGLELTVEPMEQSQESVAAAVDRWLASGRLPDAVCGYSDDLALPILSALIDRGVDVPGQVLVIGVDDVPAARAMTPSLSSIDLVVENMGDALAAGVRSAIEESEPSGRCAPPEFRVLSRESTNWSG